MGALSVFLNVKDLQRSLDAYRAVGFRVQETWKDDAGNVTFVEMALGDAEVGLGAIASNDEPEFRKWVSTPLGAGVIVSISVPNVDRLHEKAKAAGWEVETPPIDRPYGRWLGLVDPDGYSVSFFVEPRASRKKAAKRTAAKKAVPRRTTAKKTTARKTAGKAARKSSKKAGRKAPAKKTARKARR